jgi:2-oxoglutarate ferredoxin oxidoreductase subunit alpha
MGRQFRPDRGKCRPPTSSSRKKFSRYLDAEGDGIAARSLPGVHGHGAYFVRGSGHDKHGTYTEDADAYQEVVDRLARKFRLAATAVPAPEIRTVKGAQLGIVSLGGCHAAVLEAIDRLRDMGIVADYMRIRGFPFDAPVREFLDSHSVNFVVEQNRDAQLRSLLAIETGKPRDEMIPVLDYGGMPLTRRSPQRGIGSPLQPDTKRSPRKKQAGISITKPQVGTQASRRTRAGLISEL